jgi:hypothetical protein
MLGHSVFTVQAGTPMAVTGKGTLSYELGQGVDSLCFTFFCSKISTGVRGQSALGAFKMRERLV